MITLQNKESITTQDAKDAKDAKYAKDAKNYINTGSRQRIAGVRRRVLGTQYKRRPRVVGTNTQASLSSESSRHTLQPVLEPTGSGI